MQRVKRWIKEWVPTLAITIAISFTFNTYIAQGMTVPTGSMLPTIQLEDKILVEKMVGLTNFQFGDVVVFYPPLPGHEEERFVKRLIGLPGDTIEIKQGKLIRNGQIIEEAYVKEPIKYSFGPVQVPEDQYFFLGDNRNDSLDSHLWPTPFVSKDKLVGKVMFRYYPIADIGVLDPK
ncbi:MULTISPECIES: signal peptidase I [Paenibacillus]|uniref:Signal peptidase I n=1 Tax=Paenibacillus radicis (ex Xue et al. 2023) TaxID=2972489 RepID=A0ABT1YUG5_9BACL|nr:signal peptidase I [Paenibacillus radicis (ex Xue et al. 2023)]MCR8636530.1 signal peptidase I [Paenibacillus radicis (ex Xue et al. 2023)]